MIPYYGTLYSMGKNMKLQMRWEQRKEDPSLEKGQEVSPMIRQLREQAEGIRKTNAISAIDAKLKAGQRLSSQEMAYLRAHSPALYEEAVEVERERRQYKKDLENCKTKEDVERLNTQRMQSYLSQAKTIDGNPNISQGKKKELLDKICRRMMAVQDEHASFVASAKYASLPSEDEDEGEEKKRKVQQKSQVEIDDQEGELRLVEKEPALEISPGEEREAAAGAESAGAESGADSQPQPQQKQQPRLLARA